MKRSGAVLAGVGASMLLWASSAHAAYVSPPSQDFGSQAVGSTGAATEFTLSTSQSVCTSPDYITDTCDAGTSYSTDTTALPTDPGGTATVGDFVIHNLSCPRPSLYSGPPMIIGSIPAFCEFEVSFAPIAGGARSRTLSFPENPGTSASLTLTGTGLGGGGGNASAHKKCKKRHRRKHCKKHR